MTVLELYQYLDAAIPRSLSCEWDNDGLMCCPDRNREVRRVLIALDVTAAVADKAIREGYDVIVSHHPLIFKGLRALNEENLVAAKAMRLLANGVAVMSFHTRLDAMKGGVNDTLASLLDLREVEAFGENGETIGRIGVLAQPIDVERFSRNVKDVLGAPVVFYSDAQRPVYRVAVLGGAGDDDVAAARAAGADTYVSGTLKYHDMTDAADGDMNLISAGHFYTERPICTVLRRMILQADASIACTCDTEGAIRAL